MKLGIFAKTFAGGPLEVMRAARAAAYDCVQYNMACSGIGALPAEISDQVVANIRAASAETGVAVAALSATYNMIHPDRSKRLAGRESFRAMAARAQEMGTRLMTLCTGSADAEDQWRHHPDNGSAASWAEMMSEFQHLIAIAERHDLLLGIEPELANVIDGAGAARRLIAEAQSDRLRIVLDPANLAEVATPDARREIVAEAVDLLADRIVMAHAKDRHADGSFATAGQGVVDFPDFLARLKAAGFDGALVTHGLQAEEAPGVARFLRGLA